MHGVTCAGLYVRGTGKDGQHREVYLSHVVDNADSMRDYRAQCVVWQTAVNPAVALDCWHPAPGPAPGWSDRKPSTPSRTWSC